MATAPRQRASREIEYPTGDGKPMAETDVHRQDMVDVIETLGHHFAHDPKVYVSGNLLLYYEEGNARKHVAPDVLVSLGIAKYPPRVTPAFSRRRRDARAGGRADRSRLRP